MKSFGIFVLIGLSSCCQQRLLNSSTTDSVRVVIEERIVRDTIMVTLEIPVISEKIVIRDTISHLENKYSLSDALIDSNGYLYHSLSTKSVKETIKHEIEYITRDSLVYREIEVEKVVEVKKPLNWFQRLQQSGFWVLLSIVIVFIGLKIRKLII